MLRKIDKTKIFAIRLPSETIFSFELKVNTFFGIPISVGSGSLAMDVDRAMTLVKVLDGNKEKSKNFMLTSGMNSSTLEHSVPEQLFSTPENPAQGISAVKALQMANDQGIPIYTIKQSNIATILPQLQLDAGTITDIQNAVNAGKEVTVSKTNITYNGWAGCGYIIIDPTTGAGAYMISSGMNGAAILFILAAVFAILAVVTSETVVGAIFFGLKAIALLEAAIAMLYGKETLDNFMQCISYDVAAEVVAHLPFIPLPHWAIVFITIISGLGISYCIYKVFYKAHN